MRRTLALPVLLAALLAASPAAAAQEADPLPGPVPEATRIVSTAAQYRNALTDLSAVTSGTNTIRVNADFTLTADNEPTYTGTRPLVILGQGHTINGNDLNRLMDHESNARLTVRNLTFVDGRAEDSGEEDGGAIHTPGNLTLANVTISSAVALGDGGALAVSGDLAVTGGSFVLNEAAGHAGGGAALVEGDATITGATFDQNATTSPFTSGGAILIEGSALSVTDSTFTDNSSNGGGAIEADESVTATITTSSFADNEITNSFTEAGGGALRLRGPATITSSDFDGNVAGNVSGGAVYVGGTTATITDSDFDGNSATSHGNGGALKSQAGTLTVTDSFFGDNTAGSLGSNGGAISADTATIRSSTIVDNEVTAGDGGGVSVDGALVVEDSLVIANTSTGFGGGLWAADLTLNRSSLNGNTATGQGGGAFVDGTLAVTNSTISGNEASGLGGGIGTQEDTTGSLVHATIYANLATSAANIYLDDDVVLTIGATVIGAPGGGGVDCTGDPVTSTGHNVESATTCDFVGGTDQQNVVDPGLGPLRELDRSSRRMHYPLAGSPLVGHIPAVDCPVVDDQNGVERPFGTGCDIGAIEQVFPGHAFSDVPGWVEDTVRWITFSAGRTPLMEGFDDGTFRPDDDITRAQTVRLLYREADEPQADVYPAHPFTDVPAWVEDAVRWAFGEGLVTGITPTTFAPDDPITRAQVARMKYRFAGSPDVSGIDPHPFTDVPGWVEDAVRWAADTDNPLPLATGITPTTFVPDDPITRAQVARMDYRLALTPGAWDDPDNAPRQMLFRGNVP